MNALIDWLQFTYFPSYNEDAEDLTPEGVIRDILCLDSLQFQDCKGFYGYRKGLEYNNIRVLYDGNEGMGFHVQISGQGCRYLESQFGFAWDKFLTLVLAEKCNISRIDVAIDDNEYLDLKKIKKQIMKGDIVSRFRKWGIRQERSLSDNSTLGDTIYLGQRSSDVFIRIYDKELESGGAINAVRLETVMKNDKAKNFVINYLNSNFKNLAYLTQMVLNNYIRFVKKKDSNVSRSENVKWWEDFLLTAEKLSLSVGKEEITLDKVCDWVERQVSSSLKLIVETKGEFYLMRMVDKTVLNAKHQKLKAEYRRQKIVAMASNE